MCESSGTARREEEGEEGKETRENKDKSQLLTISNCRVFTTGRGEKRKSRIFSPSPSSYFSRSSHASTLRKKVNGSSTGVNNLVQRMLFEQRQGERRPRSIKIQSIFISTATTIKTRKCLSLDPKETDQGLTAWSFSDWKRESHFFSVPSTPKYTWNMRSKCLSCKNW